jgi:quercetin dioxygenase-like cupin family protein
MIKSIENADHYTWGVKCDGWHLLKSDTLSIIQERMPQNTKEQLHYHQFAQQVFYILSGTATFEINGNEQIVSTSESIHIPPKTVHRISNRHDQELTFLVISEPKSHGDRIEIND